MEIDVLERYLLDWSKALVYLKDNLEDLNALSIAICKYTKFEEGEFYTYLRKNITEEQLYGFKWGGVGGGARHEIENKVFQTICSHENLISIFDSFEETYEPTTDDPLFSKVGVHYNSEIYYVISKTECSKEILEQCFRESYIIWHALCVLSQVNFSRRKDRSIAESEIIAFAKEVQMIFLGAYDGESYICWKKKDIPYSFLSKRER